MSLGLIGGLLGLLCGLFAGLGVFLLLKLYVDNSPRFKVIWDDELLYSLYMKFVLAIAVVPLAWMGWMLGRSFLGAQ